LADDVVLLRPEAERLNGIRRAPGGLPRWVCHDAANVPVEGLADKGGGHGRA
jgi:hypothetical protein